MKRIEGEKLSPEVKKEISPKKEVETKKELAKLPEERVELSEEALVAKHRAKLAADNAAKYAKKPGIYEKRLLAGKTEIQTKTEELKSFIPELERSLFQKESDTKSSTREKAAELITEGQGVVTRELGRLAISKQEQIEKARLIQNLYSEYANTYGEEARSELLFDKPIYLKELGQEYSHLAKTKGITEKLFVDQAALEDPAEIAGDAYFRLAFTSNQIPQTTLIAEDTAKVSFPEAVDITVQFGKGETLKKIKGNELEVRTKPQTSEIEVQTDSFEEMLAKHFAGLAKKTESEEVKKKSTPKQYVDTGV